MKALILAAGYGTRLKPYTDTTPKACMPFFDLPQILYNCELLQQAGVTDIIINTHHLADKMVETINTYAKKTNLKFSFSHEPQLLNSGGGIKKTYKFFNDVDHFLVINADTMMLPKDINALKKMTLAHINNKALVTMATVSMSESLPQSKGTDTSFAHRALWTKDNLIKTIHKKQQEKETSPEHFTGCYVFSTKIFDKLPKQEEFHIFDGLIYELINNGFAFSYFLEDTYWYETGNKNDFLKAHKEIIELLKTNNPNTKILKLAWERYSPEKMKLPDYQWVTDSLQKSFNLQ